MDTAKELKKYLEDNNYTQVEFAGLIDVTPSYLSLILSGKQKPNRISPSVAKRIEKATNNNIKFLWWYE